MMKAAGKNANFAIVLKLTWLWINLKNTETLALSSWCWFF